MTTARTLAVLREWGGRSGGLLEPFLMGWPDARQRAVASFYGASHLVVDGIAYRMQTTKRGIELWVGDGPRGEPDEVVTWRAVTDAVASLDPSTLATYVAAETAVREHQRTWQRFICPPQSIGCGPHPVYGPLTLERHLYDEAHEAWAREVDDPWRAAHRALEETRNAARDALLTVEHEPADLLELLEVTA